MPRFMRGAIAAPLIAGLLIAVAGCTSSAAATGLSASGTLSPSEASTASGGASASPSPKTSDAPMTTVPPSTVASSKAPPPPSSASSPIPAQATYAKFPGIWDITSWQQYTTAQQSVEQGHQPWLLDPASVVRAWAGRWNPVPPVLQVGADTFQVTQPGTATVYTIRGTRPIPTGPAPIWVITSITHS